MDGVYLLVGTFFIIAVILVTVVLVLLEKHKYKTLRLKNGGFLPGISRLKTWPRG